LGLDIHDMLSEPIMSIVGLPTSSTLQAHWAGLKHEGDVRNSSRNCEQHVMVWKKPQRNWYKCNIDAGFHKEGEKLVQAGEAIAVLEATKELHQRGYLNVTFETDSQNVVNAIYNLHSSVSEFSVIVCKIKCLLSNRCDFEVKSIKRQANMVAHTLARAAISWPSHCIFEFIPPCIEHLLYNELI
ncbi:replication protein A 70 kDa DNA-binding subunit, partial [Trifolium pratense]